MRFWLRCCCSRFLLVGMRGAVIACGLLTLPVMVSARRFLMLQVRLTCWEASDLSVMASVDVIAHEEGVSPEIVLDRVAGWIASHDGTAREALMYLNGNVCECCGVAVAGGVA